MPILKLNLRGKFTTFSKSDLSIQLSLTYWLQTHSIYPPSDIPTIRDICINMAKGSGTRNPYRNRESLIWKVAEFCIRFFLTCIFINTIKTLFVQQIKRKYKNLSISTFFTFFNTIKIKRRVTYFFFSQMLFSHYIHVSPSIHFRIRGLPSCRKEQQQDKSTINKRQLGLTDLSALL